MPSVLEAVRALFGGDAPESPLAWGQIAARCALIYIAGLLLVRLGKSRLLSRTTALDLILCSNGPDYHRRGIASLTRSHTVNTPGPEPRRSRDYL